jgi:hypothetical protein
MQVDIIVVDRMLQKNVDQDLKARNEKSNGY